jgi:uncharacterized membrane protein (DUF441 family)
MSLIVPWLSSKMGVEDDGRKPMVVRSCLTSMVLEAPLWRAVISLPVVCIEVIGCFLHPQDIMTELWSIK